MPYSVNHGTLSQMSYLETLIEPLRHSPHLIEAVKLLQVQIEEERALRAKFYDEMTPSQKVEFIDGEVIMHSPAKNRHLDATGMLFGLMRAFVSNHGLGTVKSEKCLCVFPRNDYEPDIVFFNSAKSASLSPDTLKFPVPDLAVEVLSPSTEQNDRGVKFEDYEARGVGEYWIVDTEQQKVELFRLDPATDEYDEVFSGTSGKLESKVIKDFKIPIEAIFDETVNIEVLKALLV